MKPLKFGLRVWIAATSLLSFLGGWAILSHSAKPGGLFAADAATSANQPAQAQQLLPTLAPIPELEALTASNPVQLPAVSNAPLAFNNSAPRMRTRGS